jgi:hypothetical protein
MEGTFNAALSNWSTGFKELREISMLDWREEDYAQCLYGFCMLASSFLLWIFLGVLVGITLSIYLYHGDHFVVFVPTVGCLSGWIIPLIGVALAKTRKLNFLAKVLFLPCHLICQRIRNVFLGYFL